MFNPGRVVLSGFIFLLSASLLFAQNGNPGDEASAMIGSVAQELADNIPLNYPLILDIRAGEWTPPLGFELRRILLEKGADLREAISSGNYDNFSLADSLAEGNAVDLDLLLVEHLARLKLKNALLVQIGYEISWITIEHKSFFNYRSERLPQYVFQMKLISYPEFKLRDIQNSVYADQTRLTHKKGFGISWFEPIVASVAIGSLIYLLWNIEGK